MSSRDLATSPGSPDSQQAAANPRRPTGVTVFAILSILFGIIGLLSSVGSLLMFFFRDSINMGFNPVMDRVSTSIAYRVFELTRLGLEFFFSTGLLIAGIGLLRMSKQARKLAVVYAVYAIIATIVVKIVEIVFLYVPMLSQIERQAEQQQIITIVLMCVTVSFAIFWLIFPIAMLYYFSRTSVKQTFLNWEQTMAA